jgi:PAS domain S-box-containing protein
LRESERRLELALNAGQMGAWEWDIASGRVIWTPSLEIVHGLEPGSFGGRYEDFASGIHPEDAEAVQEEVRRKIVEGGDYHLVYRQLRGGETRWLEAFGICIPGPDGKTAKVAGVCMNITDRKRAEMERDLLVAELSHRVKNTLATVISIARQSFSRNKSIEEARRSFDGRIQALAQTHGRLADGNWSGVSLRAILADEFAPYRREDGANVRLSGPDVTLNPKAAVVLGMAVHELATNAAKYGALASREGAVSVSWQVEGEGDLLIRWAEDGGPPVSPPRRSGFGRLLLERALAADLRGKAQLDFAPEGIRCDVRLPLDALLPKRA